jgi:hypothetical protein
MLSIPGLPRTLRNYFEGKSIPRRDRLVQMLALASLPARSEKKIWESYELETIERDRITQERRRETIRLLQEEEDDGVWICEYPEVVRLVNNLRELRRIDTETTHLLIARSLLAIERITEQAETLVTVPRNRYP